MVCSCCGAKKGFLEMFFSVEESKEVKLCSECKEIVEKLDGDVLGGEKELYDLHMIQLQKRAKIPPRHFRVGKRHIFRPSREVPNRKPVERSATGNIRFFPAKMQTERKHTYENSGRKR